MQPLQNIRRVRLVKQFRKKLTFTCMSLFIPFLALSQETIPDCKDCKSLNEVQVFGFSPERFMSGLKVQKVDSINLARFQYQTLADFLQFQAPISFKSYGVGQATSISFRGTSANHTAVLWNGLNINSPTLGQSDFSTIPMLGFDKMSIQYGSAASCVGSDAVGGSVLLSSSPHLDNQSVGEFNTVLGGQYDSFQNINANAGIRFTKKLKYGLIANKTLLYGSTYNNKFPYDSRTDRKGREYLIEPSETNQRGLVQDIYFQPKSHSVRRQKNNLLRRSTSACTSP